MTYLVYYTTEDKQRHSIFDIEYYLDLLERKEKWISEVHCTPIVEGLAYFFRDKSEQDDFDYRQFIEDAGELQEIRGLLYEKYNNNPKILEEAEKFHSQFGKILTDKIKNFCDRYELNLDID